MSSGQLLLPFEAIPQPANSDVKARIAVGTIPNPEYGWLRRFDATSDFAITESVIGRNVVKNLFGRVHKPNYTRMDSFRQYTNERSFAKQNSQMNTSATMKKTPAQLIADALDSAMETAFNGKRMSQAELSRQSGVPQPTISRTLSGESIPELKTLAPLIHVLGKGNVGLAPSIQSLLPKPEAGELTDDETDLVAAYRLLDVGQKQKTLHFVASHVQSSQGRHLHVVGW